MRVGCDSLENGRSRSLADDSNRKEYFSVQNYLTFLNNRPMVKV